MSDAVSWNLQLNIKEGELEAFKMLAQEMSEATLANEPGALVYEWFVSDDGKHCHIIENYADSAAVMMHMANFGEKYAGRFLACVNPSKMIVYGTPNDEARAVLDKLGAVYLGSMAGFRR